MADSQYNKVLGNNNLRSGIELSVSSKLLLFLSLQTPHQTMGDNHPNMTISMTTKTTLPTC